MFILDQIADDSAEILAGHTAADEAFLLAYAVGLEGGELEAGPAAGRSDAVRLALLCGLAAGRAELDYRADRLAADREWEEALDVMFAGDPAGRLADSDVHPAGSYS